MDKVKRNCPTSEMNQAPTANPVISVFEKRKKKVLRRRVFFLKQIIVKQFACEFEQMK